MSFYTDQQTLKDLNIFGKPGMASIYAIFNRTSTVGGAYVLEEMFQYPLADVEEINTRSSVIQYFRSENSVFPFSTELFDAAEPYLKNTDERTKLAAENNTLGRKFNQLISADTNHKNIHLGVSAIIDIFRELNKFVQDADKNKNSPYGPETGIISLLLSDPDFADLLSEKRKLKLDYETLGSYDQILRFDKREKVKKILSHIYYLDVYISVAKVAAERKFIFPIALSREQHVMRFEKVYHPELSHPVANSLHITPENNIVFLTGANMAGKSTFMKSIGIAMFLAHMGFPVAAEKMEFSVRDGIYTSINLADNLGLGVSHFYAEVLRIKEMAIELSLGKNLFIIFDELFRGTNVKDAYEATIAITSAFAKRQNCMFVVSTHIMEAGEVLREKCPNISFRYFPTKMNKNVPVYTYQLENGITADRHGMIIINNEGILDLLKRKKAESVYIKKEV